MIRGLLRDWTGLLAGRGIAAAASCLSLSLTAKGLGPAPYGALTLLVMAATVPTALFIGWSNPGFLRHAVEEQQRTGRIGESFWSRLALFAAGALALAAGAALLRGPVLERVRMPPELYAWLLPYALSFALAEASSYWLQSVGRIRLSAFLEAGRLAAEAGGVALACGGVLPCTPESVLGVQIGTRAALVAAVLACMPRGSLLPFRVPADRIRGIVSYSWSMIPGSAAGILLPWLGVYVLQTRLSHAEVGIFQLARQATEILALGISSTMVVTAPFCIRLRVDGDLAGLADYRDRWAPFGSWIASLGMGLAVLAAPWVFPRLDPRYADSVLPFQILMAGMAVGSLPVLYFPLLAAYDRIGTMALINIGLAGTTLLSLVLMTPRWGLLGAAAAVSLSGIVLYPSYVWFTRSYPRPQDPSALPLHVLMALPALPASAAALLYRDRPSAAFLAGLGGLALAAAASYALRPWRERTAP